MLVYDRDCEFCTRSAHWIEMRWPTHTASVVASQQMADSDLELAGLSRDDVQRAAWWIAPDGLYGGHLAVARALANCGGAVGRLGSLLTAPPFRWLARPTYAAIARHRHRMPGAKPTCRLVHPSAESNETEG